MLHFHIAVTDCISAMLQFGIRSQQDIQRLVIAHWLRRWTVIYHICLWVWLSPVWVIAGIGKGKITCSQASENLFSMWVHLSPWTRRCLLQAWKGIFVFTVGRSSNKLLNLYVIYSHNLFFILPIVIINYAVSNLVYDYRLQSTDYINPLTYRSG